ncbi:MAG: peptidase prolyl oligopeptidase active site domain protein [Gemmatimonadetes bacterium]|nr:peptidase prolyl oligopeptidase active site domain protein [Gemmatimonadota bacterium]
MLRANRYAAVLLSAAAPLVAHAQHATSPAASATAALGPADYAMWETLGNGALSPDGKWVAYDLRRGNGSTELRYRTVDNETDHTVRSATAPQFTTNGRWLLYTILPDTAGAGARGGRGRRGGAAGGANAAPAANRNKVGVVDLRSGVATTFDDIQSYQLSNDGSHVALRRYGIAGRRGSDVIVRDLDAGTELTLGNVAEAVWNEDGGLLAMAIDVDGKTGNGVQLLDARTGAIRSLDAAEAHYTGLQWRAKSDDLAAMRSRIDTAFIDTSYTVLAWRGVSARGAKQAYDFSSDNAFPREMRVAGYRAPQWSEDGSTLFFGIAPREPKPAPAGARAVGDYAPARVQIWHAKDVRQFHQQEVNAAQDRQRTTAVAWHVGQNGVARLTTDPYETVQISELGNVVLTLDDAPYAAEYMSGRDVRDVYRVDPATGKRDKLLSKSRFGATLSPSGRVAMYQQDGQWWSVDLASGARANVTGKIKSAFVNMEDDHPVPERRAYGMAGFTTGEKSAIVYDRFDLWQVNLDGSNAVRLTRGKEDSTVYRCASEGGGFGGGGGGRGGSAARAATPCSLDGEGRAIDTSKPLILTATGEYNKKSGYARLAVGQPVQRLVWLDKQVSSLKKAKNADVYLMEEQTYEESPNFFVAGSTLADAKQVSHTNPFQKDHAWGKQVLMDYSNKRGDKLQMMLTYPADYQPGKKYPMVVYYYEKLSQGFHQYVVPSERSTYNTSVFSQNGYFVLRPDIVFQARNPGYSGLDCVTEAVHTVLAKVPDIDGKHVGNMGHSWGGYQSAFYAVHNPGTFAASIAGAPLTDLISFYGYTSGNSGLPETGHFETGQERMQVSLWEDPQAYIRNSTVLSIDSLHTPLLLEEGDVDGNVNPFQSQELYNFGRRLGKNVVYLVYEGENHGVARPESQADYLRRQLDWFGHYLKGEPAQPWITDGESYLTRQKMLKGASGTADVPAVQAGAPARPAGSP